MSYFNHAFQKVFIGTKGDQALVPGTAAALSQGFLMTSGVHTSQLANAGAPYSLGPGTFGFFSNTTYNSMVLADLAGNNCCPLILASASLMANDKIGPFAGGYQESNKSKYINPKRITNFYRVDPCTPQQAIVHVGSTNFTAGGQVLTGTIIGGATYNNGTFLNVVLGGGTGDDALATVTVAGGIVTGVTITNGGSGYTVGDVLTFSAAIGAGNGAASFTLVTVSVVSPNCCFEFCCDETYYLSIEVKGAPALWFANHNLYRTFQADGGCCTDPIPATIDSTLIFIQWAEAIASDPYLKDFVQPIVFDEANNPWFYTAALAVAAGWPATQIWSLYVSPGHVDGACAGLRLMGSYVETKFGNCSFQISDGFNVAPVQILAQLVDLGGDPCAFTGICVVTECPGLQGMGFGESAVRELILSESYLQNKFSTDMRIREITQGDQILNTLNRNALYTRYYIQHNVARNNNPSGIYDNDQYLLEIITLGTSTGFEAFMAQWLDTCGDCTTLDTHSCTPCVPVAVPVP